MPISTGFGQRWIGPRLRRPDPSIRSNSAWPGRLSAGLFCFLGQLNRQKLAHHPCERTEKNMISSKKPTVLPVYRGEGWSRYGPETGMLIAGLDEAERLSLP